MKSNIREMKETREMFADVEEIRGMKQRVLDKLNKKKGDDIGTDKDLIIKQLEQRIRELEQQYRELQREKEMEKRNYEDIIKRLKDSGKEKDVKYEDLKRKMESLSIEVREKNLELNGIRVGLKSREEEFEKEKN